MGILIGKWCMAQTAVSISSCGTAYSPQPIVPTHPMAWAALLKCRSKATRKAVTSSKVCVPLYVGRFADMTEMRKLQGRPGVGSVELWLLYWPEIGSEEPWIPNGPGGGWEVFGAGVVCTSSLVSCWMMRSNALNSDSWLLFPHHKCLNCSSSMSFCSRSCVMSDCSVVSDSDLDSLSRLSNLADQCSLIGSSSSNSSISRWAAANSLLRLSRTGTLASKSLTLTAKLTLRSQI